MLKTHHWDGDERKDIASIGIRTQILLVMSGVLYRCAVLSDNWCCTSVRDSHEGLRTEMAKKKANHLAGFEPTTSWLRGMCSTLVQQLLPRPQVQYNFLWSSQERKGEEKKIFTLIRFSTLRLNFQGQLRLQLIFISWVNIFNFEISETRDIINRWSRLGRLLRSEIARCNWLLLKVIRILSANFAKQIQAQQHRNSGA